MEYDLHLIKTKMSVDEIKKIIKTEIFGNYKVADERQDNVEFGVFLFRYDDDYMVLKLDYTFLNYAEVSEAVLQSLGKILKTDYFILGVSVDYPEAFIRSYKYKQDLDLMVEDRVLKHADGERLTPLAQAEWGIDAHGIWSKMKELMDWEMARQALAAGKSFGRFSDFTLTQWKDEWIKQYGNMDNIAKRICDTMFFIARKNIEQYRPDPKKVKIEVQKRGRIVLERDDNGNLIRNVIPSDGKEETKH